MKITKLITGALGLAVAASGLPLAIASATPSGPPSNTVIVTGNTAPAENSPGWMFNRDISTSTPYEFSTAKHSIGNGSIYVKPIGANPSDKFIAENFLRSAIADVTSISYDFQIAGSGTPASANQFYLNLYTTINDSTFFYDCRYDYVPATGSTSGFTTATFSMTDTPAAVTRRGGAGPQVGTPNPCPTTPAGMPSGSYIRAISISVGDTTASDMGLAGYLDKVVVAKTSGTTTYDFEPLVGPPTSKDQCKHQGWKTFNNPSFKNEDKCVDYVKSHGVPKEVEGTLHMSGPKQKIIFDVDDDHGWWGWWHKGKNDKIEYWNYEHPGGLHYKAKVLCVGGEKFDKEARVMWQIPSGHPGLSGLYVVAYTREVKNAPDLYGHNATADLATATTWCETGAGFAPIMYPVTKGSVDID